MGTELDSLEVALIVSPGDLEAMLIVCVFGALLPSPDPGDRSRVPLGPARELPCKRPFRASDPPVERPFFVGRIVWVLSGLLGALAPVRGSRNVRESFLALCFPLPLDDGGIPSSSAVKSTKIVSRALIAPLNLAITLCFASCTFSSPMCFDPSTSLCNS
ncbi:hypothetical protein FIBSPDRAFT_856916, partial [Athelia psychrophila]